MKQSILLIFSVAALLVFCGAPHVASQVLKRSGLWERVSCDDSQMPPGVTCEEIDQAYYLAETENFGSLIPQSSSFDQLWQYDNGQEVQFYNQLFVCKEDYGTSTLSKLSCQLVSNPGKYMAIEFERDTVKQQLNRLSGTYRTVSCVGTNILCRSVLDPEGYTASIMGDHVIITPKNTEDYLERVGEIDGDGVIIMPHDEITCVGLAHATNANVVPTVTIVCTQTSPTKKQIKTRNDLWVRAELVCTDCPGRSNSASRTASAAGGFLFAALVAVLTMLL